MTLLRAIPRQPKTVVMDYQFGSTVYTLWMAQPVIWISHTFKTEGFRAFVTRYGIQVVILQPALRHDPLFGADPEFLALWNETDTGPFVVLQYGDARIAVRRDLVPPE